MIKFIHLTKWCCTYNHLAARKARATSMPLVTPPALQILPSWQCQPQKQSNGYTHLSFGMMLRQRWSRQDNDRYKDHWDRQCQPQKHRNGYWRSFAIAFGLSQCPYWKCQSRKNIKNLLVIHMSHLDHPLLLNIDILFPQSFNCPPVGGNFCAILQYPCSLRLWKTYLMRSIKKIMKPSEEKIRCTQLRYSLLWQRSHQGRKLAGPSFWSR